MYGGQWQALIAFPALDIPSYQLDRYPAAAVKSSCSPCKTGLEAKQELASPKQELAASLAVASAMPRQHWKLDSMGSFG